MRISRFLAILVLILTLVSAGAPPAEARSWIRYFWPWTYTNFSKPYLEKGKIPQHSQWESDSWTPETWTDSRGSQDAVMQGFYDSGIITGQTTDDGIPLINAGSGTPVLEVGQNFLRLSDKDKRRVAAYVDSIWKVTEQNDGIFYINYERGNKPLGIYTKNGLQLQ